MSMNILYKVIAFVYRHTRLYIFVNVKRNWFFQLQPYFCKRESNNYTIHNQSKETIFGAQMRNKNARRQEMFQTLLIKNIIKWII